MSRQWLNRIVLFLLVALSVVLLSEALTGGYFRGSPLIAAGALRFAAGGVAGLGIGMVAALLGVAGGEC